MSTDASRPWYSGILVPDPRLALWDDESSFTQAGRRVGTAARGQATALELHAIGTGELGSEQHESTIEVLTLDGGHAEPGDSGATFVWRREGDTLYAGWDLPLTMTGWDPYRWEGVDDLVLARDPHAITLPDHTVVSVDEEEISGDPSPYGLRVHRHRPGEARSSVRVSERDTEPPAPLRPCLLRLPSGRLMLFHVYFDSATEQSNVRMWYSDSGGASWRLGARSCLDTSWPYVDDAYTVEKMRVAYANGGVMLLLSMTRPSSTSGMRRTLRQYASRDEGSHFALVAEWENDQGGMSFDVVASGSLFIVAYVNVTDTSVHLAARVVGSAYQDIRSVPEVIVDEEFDWASASSTLPTLADVAISRDEDGRIDIHAISQPFSLGRLRSSHDDGATWRVVGLTGIWWASDDAAPPRAFTTTCAQGRTVMLTAWEGGSHTDSIGALYLGGYSTLTMPPLGADPGFYARSGWTVTYVPWSLPGDQGWTDSTVTGSETIVDGTLVLQTTSTTIAPYSDFRAADTAREIEAEFVVTPGAGGSSVADRIAAVIELNIGGVAWVARLRWLSTTMYLFNGTTQIGFISLSGMEGVEVRVSVSANLVRTWFRPFSTVNDPVREWVEWLSAPLSPTTSSGNRVQWGHLSAAATTTNSVWHGVRVAWDGEEGVGYALGQENPSELRGRPYSSRPTYVAEGVRILAVDGPTISGDGWTISPRYDRGIHRLDPRGKTPSPRIAWEATDDEEHTIAYRISEVGDASLGNDVIGIGFYNSNVGHIEIAGRDADTNSWVVLGEAEAHDGLDGLDFVRRGNSIRATGSGSTSAPYLHLHELAGGYVALSDTVSRAISTNTQGKWGTAGKRADILLDDVADTDPDSGTAKIVPPNWVALVHLNGAAYSAIRIRILASGGGVPVPPGGAWRIGTLVVGPVVVHGDEVGWGRLWEVNPGTEVYTARDRTTRSKRIAPDARAWEHGWADGVDTTQAAGDEADPAFVTAHDDEDAEGVASVRGTPFEIEGLVRWLAGADVPAVCLPRFARLSGATVIEVLNRRDQHGLGRIASEVSIETVQGDPHADEVVRLPRFRFEEEV